MIPANPLAPAMQLKLPSLMQLKLFRLGSHPVDVVTGWRAARRPGPGRKEGRAAGLVFAVFWGGGRRVCSCRVLGLRGPSCPGVGRADVQGCGAGAGDGASAEGGAVAGAARELWRWFWTASRPTGPGRFRSDARVRWR